MSKKSKRSKKRSYSSPSREDDEKKRKKRKENKDQRQSEDKYEATNTHGSSTKHAPHHSVVHDEDSSRGRAIRKCVYRQSKTNSHTEESNVKHEGHLKSRLKSHSCHKTSCSKEKTSNVGKTIIIKTSKSVDRRPLTYTSALADPLKHEKSLKTPEKQHVCALIPHAAQKDGKWVALEKTYKFGEDPSNNQNLISNRKEKDSRRSLSVLDDSKRCATIPSYSHPGKKEKHKTTICSHAEETTCTCKPHEKTPPPYKKSNECHTYSLSSVMKRSSGSSLVKDKVWGEKNAKKVLNVKETSFAEKKISVNSAHVPKNTTSKWTSVSSPPKTVKDQRSQKQRKNISCTQQKVNTPKSSAQKVPPRRLKTTESCNSTSSASSKHRPVCAVPAALKMDDKESRAEPLSLSCKTKSTSQALLDEPSTSHDHNSQMWCDQIQIAVELHLARSEKRLEVNIGQSYGELTCMDIDYPDEGVSVTRSKEPQQDLILVLDTNILLSHLDYVKQVVSHGLEGLGHLVVLIPWVVLQELDSLKKGRGLSGSVSHLACPAISYIYNSLKNREAHLWGQSMQQAAELNDGLNAENNDDRVLQCCLQYQSLYPGCALTLCTDDKNLCSKALLSGVKAFSKTDLEAESSVTRRQNTHTPHLPVPSSTSAQATSQQLNHPVVEIKLPEEVEMKRRIQCVSELELSLKVVLADVLEKEMKAVYDELWLEIVYRKPPWTLCDVLQCFKKHWIAVFGSLVPRKLQDNIENLMKFFNSGKSSPDSSVLVSIYQAKEFVKAFKSRSSLVSNALSAMDNMVNTLEHKATDLVQPAKKDEAADSDVIMNDVEDYRQPPLPQVSCQEVWTMFHNIWANVFQVSLEVFRALNFDPDSLQSGLLVGGPPPPHDALAYLNKLSSMISQLLDAFSRVLSSGPGEDEVQNLLLVIRSNGISEEVSRLSAKVLMNCFSNQEYREKLLIGGRQLLNVKETLEACRVSTARVQFHEAPHTFSL